MKGQLVFLGSGASMGVPAFFCGCAACQEAREHPELRRSRCAILLRGEGDLLVDAPPELAVQLDREGVRGPSGLLLTHTHNDHLAGLGEMEYAVRLSRDEPLPVWASGETLETISANYAYMTDCLDAQRLEPWGKASGSGWEFQALPAEHVPGTFGYLFRAEGLRSLAYFPDTGMLSPDVIAALRGVDVLVLDATFWGENLMPASHLSVEESIRLGLECGAGTIFLTHLAMHYARPVTDGELRAFVAGFGPRVRVAYDGLKFDLNQQE